jgi:putative oxidoreductase
MAGNSNRLFIPALGPLYEKLDPYALLILRVAIGLILIPHGCQKFFGWFHGLGFNGFMQLFDKLGYHPGAVYTVIAATVELVGGICLVLGLFTRVSSLFLIIFMIFGVQFTAQKGFFWTQGGAEYSLLILVVGLVFLIRGGGKCSLDQKMSREF